MLYLIGVDHSVQHDGRAAYEGLEFQRLRDGFPTFLNRVAREIDATIIAEESNEDVLIKFEATMSFAFMAASQIGIRHLFCEPRILEREKLGIKNPGELHDFERREKFWLNKLIAVKDENILFVLGAYHVQSFSECAKSAQFRVMVIEEYYGREYFVS